MLTWVIKTYMVFVASNENIPVINNDILQVRFTFVSALTEFASSKHIFRVDNDMAVCRKRQLRAFQF